MMLSKNGFALLVAVGTVTLGCGGSTPPAATPSTTTGAPATAAAAATGDADGDGIPDGADKCPDKKEDGQAPDPKDGCPKS
jgi:hypothetical protein